MWFDVKLHGNECFYLIGFMTVATCYHIPIKMMSNVTFSELGVSILKWYVKLISPLTVT